MFCRCRPTSTLLRQHHCSRIQLREQQPNNSSLALIILLASGSTTSEAVKIGNSCVNHFFIISYCNNKLSVPRAVGYMKTSQSHQGAASVILPPDTEEEKKKSTKHQKINSFIVTFKPIKSTSGMEYLGVQCY